MAKNYGVKINHPVWFYLLIVLLWFTAGCGRPVDMEAERQHLLRTDREFSETSAREGAAEAFRKYLLPEALQLPAGQLPIRGNETIYQEMIQAGDGYTLTWQPQEAGVAASGELGYSWGIYTVTSRGENGEAQSRQGKYLNVWKKDDAGNWRVLIDTGNANPRE